MVLLMPARHIPAGACRGLSLVELLVAIALGVTLSFGAMNLLLHSKRSYFQAEELARVQENGRHALRYLSYELQMAGYLATRQPDTRLQPGLSGSACFDYLIATGRPVEHVNDVTRAGSGGGSELPGDCLSGGTLLPGTDVLLTRRTASAPALSAAQQSGPIDADGIYLRQSASFGPPRLQRGGADLTAGDALWEYLPQVLFLRDYSAATGDGVPALCRKRLGRSSNRMAPTQCLIEGIENLQLEFGIDDNGDGQADRYKAIPGAAELGRAVAARIYLLVRSVRPLPGYRDDRSYRLGSTRVPATGDAFYRRLMQTTVVLRNNGGVSS